ncbi:hypothetical protein JXQ70_05390 [bacterium]|nr:hypothetical protein [bacterium]
MNTLGIRAEDKNRWEKRVPLVPEHIAELKQSLSFPVVVESPSIRVFPDDQYLRSGAQVTQDINQAEIIIGVKEIPIEKIVDDKVYLFFSHTIKGQKPNMPLLQRILDCGSTLIDYERIVDDANRRLIFFGNYAGTAGAIDILWLIGLEWQRLGILSPLLEIKQALYYPSVSSAREEIASVARKIEARSWPIALQPMVIGIWGYGNVSRGAQDILTLFRHEYIQPDHLASLRHSGNFSPDTLYLCVFHEDHMVRHRHGQAFNLQHYYQHPEDFEPITEPFLPYLNVLINAVYWNKQYPHFFSRHSASQLWERLSEPRFFAIADLSCDVAGGVELTLKTTDSGQPAFKYNPITGQADDDLTHPGYLILAVDNLPGELAYDSSCFFSNLLKEYIPNLVQADFQKPLTSSGLSPALQRAVITYRGQLTPAYQYLEKFLH